MFTDNFLWGAASASTQVEGAYAEDGKGLSIWDIAPSEKIRQGANCHIACDHYHRFREDVALMKKMGLKAYRFSVSWPRIQPEEDRINPEGISFYRELVQELKNAGIEPLITLYHWDLPVWVQQAGGWRSDRIVEWFVRYTQIVVENLSDHVQWWMTFNEPLNFLYNGYVTGYHSPFIQDSAALQPITIHCLQANAEAIKAIRKTAKLTPKVGIAVGSQCAIPKNSSSQAMETAYKETFDSYLGTLINRWWCDPMILGQAVQLDESNSISQELAQSLKCDFDFIGMNIYQPFDSEAADRDNPDPDQRTSMGWPIISTCMYWNIRFFWERYGLPILITENGAAFEDTLTPEGTVHDPRRSDYIRDHLVNLKQAAAEGIPVLGYLYWSIMDNFEWTMGYDPRFGLIYIDYATQERILKDSAQVYRQIIETNGKNL